MPQQRDPDPLRSAKEAQKLGLPVRVFLYTLDQIAFILDVQEQHLKTAYIHWEGRSLGAPSRDKLVARNIAPEGQIPEWRISETDFVRWLRFKGFRLAGRGNMI